MKKAVPVKGTSPKVGNWNASFPGKYSTGSKGRAVDPQLGRKQRRKGNPPKGGKK